MSRSYLTARQRRQREAGELYLLGQAISLAKPRPIDRAVADRAIRLLDAEAPLPVRWEFEQLKAEKLRRLVTDLNR